MVNGVPTLRRIMASYLPVSRAYHSRTDSAVLLVAVAWIGRVVTLRRLMVWIPAVERMVVGHLS